MTSLLFCPRAWRMTSPIGSCAAPDARSSRPATSPASALGHTPPKVARRSGKPPGPSEPLGDRESHPRVIRPERRQVQPVTRWAGLVEQLRKLDRGVEAPAEKEGDDCHLATEAVQRLLHSG